ncbi:MAG TPA: extracellular solute-binding protein, partial [Devosia sp.]|nr:extracellular solute-binding protein [Devosia sp.]
RMGRSTIAALTAVAMLATAVTTSYGAGAWDTSDPEYTARIEAAVSSGKLASNCSPSAAPAPDAAFVPAAEPTAELIAAANAEGQFVLNSGISDGPTVDAYQAAFQARFPQITMSIAAGRSAQLEERFLADHAAGNNQVDAVISNKINWMEEAFSTGAMLPLDQTIPDIFSTWPEGSWRWVTDAGSTAPAFNRSFGIAYNSDLVTGDLIPKEFADLANPAFKGQLLALDPSESVTYARQWLHILNVVGEETFKKIGENIQQPIYPDIQVAAQVLGAGGAMVIMEMGGNVAATMIANGAPLVGVMPKSATGTQYAYGVSSTAPHPNAAKLFGMWLYSAEGQYVMSCAAYAGTVAYTDQGAEEYIAIEDVSEEQIAHIRSLLGI